jgi:hypothetical protein
MVLQNRPIPFFESPGRASVASPALAPSGRASEPAIRTHHRAGFLESWRGYLAAEQNTVFGDTDGADHPLERSKMTETDDGRALPQAESIAGLGLVITSLAYYLSPGAERAKLVAWMERQTEIFEAGFPPDVALYFRRFVEGLRKGEDAELLKSAHVPEHGPH